MTTRGRLDDVSLPDLLQLLSGNLRTGKLTLSYRNGFGTILFRDGRVIYAASNRPRETFGSILINRGLVDEATLLAALEQQNAAPEERRLGSILAEMGALSEQQLRTVMRDQVGEVLRDLLSWREGFFKFQAGSIPDHGEVGVDCQDLVLSEGLTAEGVLVDAVRRNRRDGGTAGDPFAAEAEAAAEPSAAGVAAVDHLPDPGHDRGPQPRIHRRDRAPDPALRRPGARPRSALRRRPLPRPRGRPDRRRGGRGQATGRAGARP